MAQKKRNVGALMKGRNLREESKGKEVLFQIFKKKGTAASARRGVGGGGGQISAAYFQRR